MLPLFPEILRTFGARLAATVSGSSAKALKIRLEIGLDPFISRSVSTIPGLRLCTPMLRMPARFSSSANDVFSCAKPVLVALCVHTALESAAPHGENPKLKMWYKGTEPSAPFCLRMRLMASRQHRMDPSTFVPTTAARSSCCTSNRGLGSLMCAALLIQRCTVPRSREAAAASSDTSPGQATSQRTPYTEQPGTDSWRLATASATRSESRPQSMTLSPPFNNSFERAYPNPLVPPVITTPRLLLELKHTSRPVLRCF
mmetsp:Transcript_13664/g.26229  ORF Transcript_13664/g.26229 Transcript_13664/m.26229 type:complete len:258 (-) Transcript_13664:297-1070(-)